ncbi:hypothetical protein WSS15_13810 [Acetobacter pasteurianus]|uniref:Flagellin assembly protein n=1 Tax=Acetobacter pasteurianus NBRC 3278 TaxID=1226660 RepID=A0A401X6C3_ACEPA|nr:flagellar biosynthesis regulator FlaF [Acetobacter pasteurianus]GCD60364.1 hypothetical protein NBRC3277_2939 [Acetobacter pasteurianus NBRC 3277]GCD63482.1 hypothetical protein NBRC3278_2575 [Acetobacter pasteurianus NBRC 3278]GCD70715.1 hypothetical protein NBRC3280_3350 [Acetobacter pasteurianus NBRC 3280]GLH28731.1 hypothetical protein WSS15_13810 [Acetobacter pasteurianus]
MNPNRGMNAYKSAASQAMSDREMDALCFSKLLAELQAVEHSSSVQARNNAILKSQRLWGLLQKANAVDAGRIPNEDRLLFVRMADQAQRYGIRAILNKDLSIKPLIICAQNVLDGLSYKAPEVHEEVESGGDCIM